MGRIKRERLSDPIDENESDYEVGYGKPPKRHQFKPGQSGNPKGRKKDARNTRSMLTDILNERVPVKINGKEKSVLTSELLLRAQTRRAAQGDPKSFKLIFDMIAEFGIGITPATENGQAGVRIFIPHNNRDEPKGPVYQEDPSKPAEEWEIIENFKNPGPKPK